MCVRELPDAFPSKLLEGDATGSAEEFELLPLRVHTFLAGVPLHDVWAVDLKWTRPGVTLDDFLQARCACRSTLPPVARAPEYSPLYRASTSTRSDNCLFADDPRTGIVCGHTGDLVST
jgi:hypothetical protein